MVNYGKSMIYKLCCKDTSITDIYIGSTTNFNRRKQQHKTSCNCITSKKYNRKVYKFIREHGGFENWDIILIENVKVETKRELEKEERRVMEELKSSLNSKSSFRTEEERKDYFEINKKQLYAKKKLYREANKEELKIKKKQYTEKHKEELYIKRKAIISCECGSTFTYSNKSQHLKTKKHLDFISQ